jgi:hypothetical protein
LVPRATLAASGKAPPSNQKRFHTGWNDPRHPWAQESFGAVPAVPGGRGASILNGFPSLGGRAESLSYGGWQGDIRDGLRLREFEADIIKERVKAGLTRARAEGKRLVGGA